MFAITPKLACIISDDDGVGCAPIRNGGPGPLRDGLHNIRAQARPFERIEPTRMNERRAEPELAQRA